MSAELVKHLERYKKQKGLTYAQLAGELKIPENYLYRWRKKRRIQGIYFRVISSFLNLSIDQ